VRETSASAAYGTSAVFMVELVLSASTALDVSDGGSEGSLGASEYQPRGVLGPTPQRLFLSTQLNMADAVGEYSTTLTSSGQVFLTVVLSYS
jgi:hypothetical protein